VLVQQPGVGVTGGIEDGDPVRRRRLQRRDDPPDDAADLVVRVGGGEHRRGDGKGRLGWSRDADPLEGTTNGRVGFGVAGEPDDGKQLTPPTSARMNAVSARESAWGR
jgi:hypothetical protein